jgi:endogenous inhibitor of DNA gyrase (YacG/DUF329 family)
MGYVMIVCPQCNRQIDTGLQAKTLAFFKSFQSLNGEVSCTYCGHKTHWTEKDLFLKKDNLFPPNLRVYMSH